MNIGKVKFLCTYFEMRIFFDEFVNVKKIHRWHQKLLFFPYFNCMFFEIKKHLVVLKMFGFGLKNDLLGPFIFTLRKIIERTSNNTSCLIRLGLTSFGLALLPIQEQ